MRGNMDITFCELREKEVVNLADGKRLGRVQDLVIEPCGKVIGLVVPGEKKLIKALSRDESIFVAWKNIVKLGDDVILIDLNGIVPCNNNC